MLISFATIADKPGWPWYHRQRATRGKVLVYLFAEIGAPLFRRHARKPGPTGVDRLAQPAGIRIVSENPADARRPAVD
jgi:hypothetical protein